MERVRTAEAEAYALRFGGMTGSGVRETPQHRAKGS